VSWIGSDLPNALTRESFIFLKARINKFVLAKKVDQGLLLQIIDEVNNAPAMTSVVLREIVEYLRVKLMSGYKSIVYRTIYLSDALVKNCGPKIYVLLGSKLFMRTLSKISRAWILKGSQRAKRLGEYGLDTMQAWGEAFETRKSLYPHIYGSYMHLRSKPYITFPRQQYDPKRVPIILGPITRQERELAAEFRVRNDAGGTVGAQQEDGEWEDYSQFDSPTGASAGAGSHRSASFAVLSSVDPLSVSNPQAPPRPRSISGLRRSPIVIPPPAEDLLDLYESHHPPPPMSEFLSASCDSSSMAKGLPLHMHQARGGSAYDPNPPLSPTDPRQHAAVMRSSSFDAAFSNELSSQMDDGRYGGVGVDPVFDRDPFYGFESMHSVDIAQMSVSMSDASCQCDMSTEISSACSVSTMSHFPPPAPPPRPPQFLPRPTVDAAHAAVASSQESFPDGVVEQMRQHAIVLHQLEQLDPLRPLPRTAPRPTSTQTGVTASPRSDPASRRPSFSPYYNPSSDPNCKVVYYGNTRLVKRDV
jgi:hypothetical protein